MRDDYVALPVGVGTIGRVADDRNGWSIENMMAEQSIDWVRQVVEAPWRPRDSQGAVVYKDRLWIFGGWHSSHEAPPRDVWSSPDGRSWSCVQPQAPWIHSDLPMATVFDGRMWMMGGWYNGRLPGHSASNEVWHSTDGVEWTQATRGAGWSPRLAAGVVTFNGFMWILGGIENYYFGDDRSLRNDVWRSADGVSWECVCEKAAWSPRAYHRAVVHDGKMWLFGGGNYVPNHVAHNDVWCSDDGVNWRCVADAAPWSPRLWFASVVHRDRMWVLGGWSQASDNFGDVWHSRDGRRWEQLHSNVIWKARHEHAAWVLNDRIHLAAGHARPLSSEVWTLDLPPTW